MTFPRLWAFLAVALPSSGRLIANMSSVDLAYHLRAGAEILAPARSRRRHVDLHGGRRAVARPAVGRPGRSSPPSTRSAAGRARRPAGRAGRDHLRVLFVVCRRRGLDAPRGLAHARRVRRRRAVALALRPQLLRDGAASRSIAAARRRTAGRSRGCSGSCPSSSRSGRTSTAASSSGRSSLGLAWLEDLARAGRPAASDARRRRGAALAAPASRRSGRGLGVRGRAVDEPRGHRPGSPSGSRPRSATSRACCSSRRRSRSSCDPRARPRPSPAGRRSPGSAPSRRSARTRSGASPGGRSARPCAIAGLVATPPTDAGAAVRATRCSIRRLNVVVAGVARRRRDRPAARLAADRSRARAPAGVVGDAAAGHHGRAPRRRPARRPALQPAALGLVVRVRAAGHASSPSTRGSRSSRRGLGRLRRVVDRRRGLADEQLDALGRDDRRRRRPTTRRSRAARSAPAGTSVLRRRRCRSSSPPMRDDRPTRGSRELWSPGEPRLS